jgi:V/A-type H+-transporting ATPase subunit A
VKVFWSLKAELAYARHFPAIDWLTSYSLYMDNVRDYMSSEIAEDFLEIEQEAMKLLEEEDELQEMVRLVGEDALSARERRILITARLIREDFLHQNAFHDVDTYTSIEKQYLMLKNIITFHREAEKHDAKPEELDNLDILENIARMKFIEEKEMEKIKNLQSKIKEALSNIATVKEEVAT